MQSKLFLWRNLVWAVIIFILCSIPGDNLPRTSLLKIPYFDKIVHFSMFFIMAIFLKSALYFKTKLTPFSIAFISVTIITIYGSAIELLQHYYFVNRSGNFMDALADIAGGMMGVLLFSRLKKQKDLLLNRKPLNRIGFLRKIL